MLTCASRHTHFETETFTATCFSDCEHRAGGSFLIKSRATFWVFRPLLPRFAKISHSLILKSEENVWPSWSAACAIFWTSTAGTWPHDQRPIKRLASSDFILRFLKISFSKAAAFCFELVLFADMAIWDIFFPVSSLDLVCYRHKSLSKSTKIIFSVCFFPIRFFLAVHFIGYIFGFCYQEMCSKHTKTKTPAILPRSFFAVVHFTQVKTSSAKSFKDGAETVPEKQEWIETWKSEIFTAENDPAKQEWNDERQIWHHKQFMMLNKKSMIWQQKTCMLNNKNWIQAFCFWITNHAPKNLFQENDPIENQWQLFRIAGVYSFLVDYWNVFVFPKKQLLVFATLLTQNPRTEHFVFQMFKTQNTRTEHFVFQNCVTWNPRTESKKTWFWYLMTFLQNHCVTNMTAEAVGTPMFSTSRDRRIKGACIPRCMCISHLAI